MSDSLEKGLNPVSTQSIESLDNEAPSGTLNKLSYSFKRKQVQYDEDYLSTLDPNQRTNYILANQPLRKSLKKRHIKWIAYGGTLGTGLFIGLGYSISQGPGATLIGFGLVGFAIYCVIQAAAELSVAYPVSGSFASHVSRFVDPALGFTIASNYGLSWLISFPSELIGCSMTIRYWNDQIDPVAWVAIFWVFVVTLNLFGVRAYGESEFLLSIIKIIAIVIFIIIGIVLIAGGGPHSQGYIGAKYWHDPGAFASPVFKSICSTFISAGFSYGGSELAVLASAESKNASHITKATKQVFWRIALFYITTIVVISCLVPRTDERLLGGSSSEDISASPFVIALSNTGQFGVKVSHFMNAVILVAVLSVANSCVYASSRVIQSLGASGQLPSIFAYIDNEGRPLVGIITSSIFGLLCFVVASDNQSTVFTWLFSLCSISAFFTWFSICLSHIRFRLALKKQGRSTEELGFKAVLGIYGSIIGAIILILIIIGEIWISVYPIGSGPDVLTFFQNCLSIPLMIVIWLGYRLISKRFFKKPYIPLNEIDLDTGKRYPDIEELKAQKKLDAEILASKPLYYRIYNWWC
ncbi:S-adenosylmethionine permease [Wickerhamomyces ciferrii]|uniref:S-adenosylmethionine permease n=1 Tax=Wickerhamomyces ciferrii (strain ATCC 14091 / BCRC 22168 / CBS 111 / JCM 3599 / NBRC 0793 / NRRL Y-1031 F-60-10) TaxID=1206466 RepID=K0KZN6_WICCF|nr:S-adenosylmethionine permease [Wickerhamomyces ciferrii]CCH46623.1 S-adenosylmethionine permease [Wickerhamomyces ciferrii]